MHKFTKYLHKHGHYPRARIRNGEDQTIEVIVAPSYIHLCRLPYGHDIYLTRSQLVQLLKWLVPLVKQMEGDFDVEDAMKKALAFEAEFLEEFRAQKRDRRGPRPRRRRRK